MATSDTVYFLKCEITRSPFSGERFFEVKAPGVPEYEGEAPVGFCRTLEGKKLKDKEPLKEESLDGFVLVTVVPRYSGQWALNYPNSEYCFITNKKELKDKGFLKKPFDPKTIDAFAI